MANLNAHSIQSAQLRSGIYTLPANAIFEVVEQLPTENIKTSVIYCVPIEGEENKYDMYGYIDSAWVSIGSEVDLSDYYTKEEINTLLGSYYTQAQIDTFFENYYTKSEIDSLITGKKYTSTIMPPWMIPYTTTYTGKLKIGDLWEYSSNNVLKIFEMVKQYIQNNRVYFEWKILYPNTQSGNSFAPEPPSQEVLSVTTNAVYESIGISGAIPRPSYMVGDFYIYPTHDGAPYYLCQCSGVSGYLDGNTYTHDMYWGQGLTTVSGYTKEEVDALIATKEKAIRKERPPYYFTEGSNIEIGDLFIYNTKFYMVNSIASSGTPKNIYYTKIGRRFLRKDVYYTLPTSETKSLYVSQYDPGDIVVKSDMWYPMQVHTMYICSKAEALSSGGKINWTYEWKKIPSYYADSLSDYNITNAYTKTEIDAMIGDIETLLSQV